MPSTEHDDGVVIRVRGVSMPNENEGSSRQMVRRPMRERLRNSAQDCRNGSIFGANCIWYGIMTFIVLGLIIVYLDFESAPIWIPLGANGKKPEPTMDSVGAYCETLDVILYHGGKPFDRDAVAVNQTKLYRFDTGRFEEINSSLIPNTYGASLVAVQGAPERSFTSCRFLLTGGANSTDETDEDFFSSDVVMIEVFKDEEENMDIQVSIVNDVGSSRPSPKFLAAAGSFEKSMFVIGGASGSGSSAVTSGELWRFDLIDNDDLSVNGRWTEIIFDEDSRLSPARVYDAASTVYNDRFMFVYSGKSRELSDGTCCTDKPIQRHIMYDLSALAKVGINSTDDLEGALMSVDTSSDDNLYRFGASISAQKYDDNEVLLFVYGGQKLTGQSSGDVVANDFVSFTSVNIFNGEATCADYRRRFAWCGVTAQYPGDSNDVVGITRVNDGAASLVAQRQLSSGIEMWEMSLPAMFNGAQRFNAVDLEESGGFAGIVSLQYSFIAACVFLMFSLLVLYRHRVEEHHEFEVARGVKPTGVSRGFVAALPLVKYNKNGHHVRVKVEVDAQGNETVIELDSDATSTDSESSSGNVESAENGNNQNDFGDDVMGDCCAICLTEFEEEEVLRKLRCDHLFHEDCVDPWIMKKGCCPLCKQHVITGKSVYEQEEENRQEPVSRTSMVESTVSTMSAGDAHRGPNSGSQDNTSPQVVDEDVMERVHERMVDQPSQAISKRLSKRLSNRSGRPLSRRQIDIATTIVEELEAEELAEITEEELARKHKETTASHPSSLIPAPISNLFDTLRNTVTGTPAAKPQEVELGHARLEHDRADADSDTDDEDDNHEHTNERRRSAR